MACPDYGLLPSSLRAVILNSSSRYQLVIFDFDGTLADSFPWFIGVFSKIAEEFHFRPVSPAEYDLVRGYDTRQLMAHLRIPLWKLPRIAARFRSWSARDANQIPLFPGIPDLLAQLHRRGTKLAIVSSNSPETIQLILGHENIAHFEHLECGVNLLGKASRLRKVVRRLGFEPRQAIYIGDEIRDATAAHESSIAFGAVAWGYTKIDALRQHNPAAIIHEPADILAL